MPFRATLDHAIDSLRHYCKILYKGNGFDLCSTISLNFSFNYVYTTRFLFLAFYLVFMIWLGIVTAPYLYCTHYSSAMIVASFLIRMEPFTQSFLRLQVS